MIRQWLLRRKARAAKKFWAKKHGPCEHTHIIQAAIPLEQWQGARVLEFGANWGGNLVALETIGPKQLVGIDINPVVTTIGALGPKFVGILADETSLAHWTTDFFDIAFTVSVFDHFADPLAVEKAIAELLRLARTVILFEPWIDGVHQDVSNRPRSAIKIDLIRPEKVFKHHCYLWDYDAMLHRLFHRSDVAFGWTKTAMPQHEFSLGPFYQLYVITRR